MKAFRYALVMVLWKAAAFGYAQSFDVSPMPQQETYEFFESGFKVIYRYVPNEIIVVQVGFRGGVARVTKEFEGMEKLALATAVESGTKNMPRDAFHDDIDAHGIRIGSSAAYDYSTFQLQCLKDYADRGLHRFAELIRSPYFDTTSFEQVRHQMISGVQQALSTPDAFIRRTSIQETFKGYEYEKAPEGSPESLEKITYDQARRFYFEQLLDKSNMVIVVVGDITKLEVREWIRTALKDIPSRNISIRPHLPEAIAYNDSRLKEYSREEMATYYYRGITGAPPRGSEWEIPMMVGFNILDDRFFVEIRTKRNLSYAPAAFMARAMKVPYGILYVSTTDPSAAARVMVDELKKIKKEGFTAKELRDKKEVFLTYHYMGEESNASLAGSLMRSEMTGGGWREAVLFNQKVQSVTLEKMNEAFRKYIRGIRWYYVGDPKAIKDSMVFEEVIE